MAECWQVKKIPWDTSAFSNREESMEIPEGWELIGVDSNYIFLKRVEKVAY